MNNNFGNLINICRVERLVDAIAANDDDQWSVVEFVNTMRCGEYITFGN